MVDPIICVFGMIVVFLGAMMIFAKNPISSAFCLVALMIVLGGIYGFVGAHFVAALQIIVYAGAVMVLFVFSIMLMNMNKETTSLEFFSARSFAALCGVIVIFIALGTAFIDWQMVLGKPQQGPYNLSHIKEAGGNVFILSSMMFSKAYLIFELVSLLLPIAVAGALVLAKRKVD